MKKIISFLLFVSVCITVAAQDPKKTDFSFTEASDLTLIGKIMDTPNPYHRVDTCVYKGFTKNENRQVRCSAGLAVLFSTDSPIISVKTEYGYQAQHSTTMTLADRGYDLYIKKDGRWLWAAAKVHGKNNRSNVTLINNMDGTMKDCMLYLPIYSEEYSVKVGIKDGCTIKALESPFRHRVAIFGSSFTHGISTSRAGMSYPMQFQRRTGIQMLSLGCSGNCKMQPYFADVLADVKADAFVFDAFSNPNAKMIEARLEPFIKRLSEAHPGVPLIFQQTIYRESRNFNKSNDNKERAKMETAERLMKQMMEKYPDVYFIYPNASSEDHEYSVDGTHPDDHGYFLWEQSIEKPLLDILAKYGIR